MQHVATSGTNLTNAIFNNNVTSGGLTGTGITINTTTSSLIDVRAEWSTANSANTITLEAGYAEILG
jgi:hypothetical protein